MCSILFPGLGVRKPESVINICLTHIFNFGFHWVGVQIDFLIDLELMCAKLS